MKFIHSRTIIGVFLATVLAGFAIFNRSIDQNKTNDISILCQNQLDAKPLSRTELLFGLSKSNGSLITESEFQRFVDREITPLFPDGLTVLPATGQFKSSDAKVVKEGSKLLLLLYPSKQESDLRIEQIRKAYKSTFQQESVIRIDQRSCVAF